MGMQVFCPSCDRSCRINPDYLGRRVRCPGCKEIFKAEEVPIADVDDDPSPAVQPEAPVPLVEPGVPHNPFVGSSTLAAADADPSAFEFDFGDEDAPRRRSHDDDDDDDGDERPARDRDRKLRRSDRDAADTEYAWDKKDSPPDELPLDRSLPTAKKAAPATRAEPEEGSPFAFGAGDPDDGRERAKGRRRDDEDDDKPVTKKKPARTEDDAAAFLGLQDELESPPEKDDKPAPKKNSSRRVFFHLRQSGYWSDAYLFRVFVNDDELAFVTAASGKDIGAMEEALQSDALVDFEKKIRNKVLDLDELSVDALVDSMRNSFRWAVAKIVEASIDAPSLGSKILKGSRTPAVLHLVHKSKGPVTFDFPSDDDVDRAINYLPDLLGKDLDVNVRWDKASKRFVKR